MIAPKFGNNFLSEKLQLSQCL